MGDLTALSVGAIQPTLLRPAGDDMRINWGKAYLAATNVSDSIHDEDLMVYINGVLAANGSGYTGAYEILEMRPEARAHLKAGATVTLAVSCHQTNGGQYVDVGFAHENMALR